LRGTPAGGNSLRHGCGLFCRELGEWSDSDILKGAANDAPTSTTYGAAPDTSLGEGGRKKR